MTASSFAALDADMRSQMLALAAAGRIFALATLVSADGGPRRSGAQMVVTSRETWGSLSSGCIDADLAFHGREVICSGSPRRLVYGAGSRQIDIRLPCGGRMEVLVERVLPGDPALVRLAELVDARTPAIWWSDGVHRRCADASSFPAGVKASDAFVTYEPVQRLLVFGEDAFALAIAQLGGWMGWETKLIHQYARRTYEGHPFQHLSLSPSATFAKFPLDHWTAVAVATHETDLDHEAVAGALLSPARYVGLMGSRRRLPQRLTALRSAGVNENRIRSLSAPIGLAIAATSPKEVAVAVIAEIVALGRRAATNCDREMHPSVCRLATKPVGRGRAAVRS